MAMNVSSASSSDEGDVLSEMNTTPLIDVMLVLLVMLIITIPIQLHSVDLNMPNGHPPPPMTKPEVVRIDIDAEGGVHWNGELVSGQTALEAKLSNAAAQPVQPELHLRPDKKAAYKTVATVMAAVQRLGLTKIGLIGGEQFI
jgi:biopolymer transport protein ExbD